MYPIIELLLLKQIDKWPLPASSSNYNLNNLVSFNSAYFWFSAYFKAQKQKKIVICKNLNKNNNAYVYRWLDLNIRGGCSNQIWFKVFHYCEGYSKIYKYGLEYSGRMFKVFWRLFKNPYRVINKFSDTINLLITL